MKIKFLLICVLVFFINCNQSLPDLEKISLDKNETPTLPIKIDPDSVIYLRNLIDDDFQVVLQNAILKDSKWKRLINQKKIQFII